MDPLRPFSDLIRALWKSSAPRVDRTATAARPQQPSTEAPADSPRSGDAGVLALKSEIRARLRQVGMADPQRAREVFVAAVMAVELGLSPESGPGFTDVAQHVATRIGSHQRLSRRLHLILAAIAEGRSVE